MAAKKVYAVKKGKKTGIYDNWDACKAAVAGFSGAEYRGFTALDEACRYLGISQDETCKYLGGSQDEVSKYLGDFQDEASKHMGSFTDETCKHQGSSLEGACKYPESAQKAISGFQNMTKEEKLLNQPQDTLITYVDGSYEHSLKKYAFGCVFLLPDGTIYVENGSGNNPDSAKLRNVTGEMLGSMFAVRWAIKNGFSKLEIRYDYEGVEKWVTGAWKSKTELTQKYAEAMRRWSNQISLKFTKVAAHTNVYYNEMADRLAKQALVEKDGVPEIRSKEEMEPWTEQD